jgi:hypothetical protein
MSKYSHIMEITCPGTVLPQLRPLVTNMHLYPGYIWPRHMQQISHMLPSGEEGLGEAQLAITWVPHMASSILLRVRRAS